MKKYFYDIYTDGGVKRNLVEGAMQIYIKPKNIKKEQSFLINKRISFLTNNEAEYKAVIEALENIVSLQLLNNEIFIVNIHLNFKLVYNHLNGLWKVGNKRLLKLYQQVKELEKKIEGKVYYHLITKEKKRLADKLVKQVLKGK